MSDVICFSWNTQSNRIGETLNQELMEKHRSGYLSGWKYSGLLPDFWFFMEEKISDLSPKIVCVAFQEDARPGSYFHSHFLPEYMPKIGYRFLFRSTKMGVGKTSYQGLSEGDLFVRGVRTSIYVKKDDEFDYSPKEKQYVPSVFQNKTATAIYLNLPEDECIAFINLHLPFDSGSLNEMILKRDEMVRQNAIFDQNKFLNEATRTLLMEAPVNVNYIFCIGDFNYRYFPFAKWSADLTGQIIISRTENTFDQIREADEFYVQMKKKNIYKWEEGVKNQGPTFPPTCKLLHNRIPGACSIKDYSLGKDDQRVPSHCDRIVYLSHHRSRKKINCKIYDRFDVGNMVKSDHAGVYGIYGLEEK